MQTKLSIQMFQRICLDLESRSGIVVWGQDRRRARGRARVFMRALSATRRHATSCTPKPYLDVIRQAANPAVETTALRIFLEADGCVNWQGPCALPRCASRRS